MDKEFFLMTGLGFNLNCRSFWNEESWFDPYLRVGANYLRHDYTGLTFPRTDKRSMLYNEMVIKGKANHFTVSYRCWC
jgi:hypothetical protein